MNNKKNNNSEFLSSREFKAENPDLASMHYLIVHNVMCFNPGERWRGQRDDQICPSLKKFSKVRWIPPEHACSLESLRSCLVFHCSPKANLRVVRAIFVVL